MSSRLWALSLSALVACTKLSLSALVACTKPNPASCLDDFCDDPALPFCDADGSIGGVPDTCIAVACAPNEFAGCRGDQALVCNASGDNFEVLECEFGCGSEGCLPCNTSECQPPEKHITPKYLAGICDDLATNPALTIDADTTIDTSDDAACTSVEVQPTGPEICVLRANTITIDRNQTLSVKGTRVLALVADRDLLIDGILDVSASAQTSGPGGGFIKSGTGEGNAGGGAGARHAGAPGATATVNGGAANGGAAAPHPGSLNELFGGTQATKGSASEDPGGGGGGVTLISCRAMVSIPGLVDAGGGGGDPDSITLPRKPAGGGGSGGTIVVQAMAIEITGELYANGGGGGGSGSSDSFNGAGRGEDGRRSVSRANGGTPANGGGAGGSGGTFDVPIPGFAANNRGGAGGGSAGFILTYTPQDVTPTLNALAVSPPFEPNLTVGTN